MDQPTDEKLQQVLVFLLLCDAVGETVKECGADGAPSGVIYAALMSKGVSLGTYEQCLDILLSAGKIKQSNNVLYWIG